MKPARPSPRQATPAVTRTTRGQQSEPRLPHEHDESSDSQAPVNQETKVVGRQAARDVARGLVDTDRGPVMERIKDEHFGPAPPTKPKAP